MNIKPILLSIICPLSLSGCFEQPKNYTKSNVESEPQTEEERSYDEIEQYKIFWSDIFHQPYPLYYVYLYSESCSHCKSIKYIMVEYGLNQTLPLYFVESSPEHSIGENFDKNAPVYDINSLLIRGYPTLLRLEENVVVYIAEGTKEIRDELKI